VENSHSLFNDSEDSFKKKYPWSCEVELIPRLQKRYSDFKRDNRFWNLLKPLKENTKYCGLRYLDWNKKSGMKKHFYSPEILKEFDKHYTKKGQA
jgi:hypothetical protein